ncbi:MAG: Mor transcription activator family protein [Pseudomonadota bacterium]
MTDPANLARVASLTRELAEIASRKLQDALDVESAQADELGLQIAEELCAEFGGQLIYLPTGFAARIDARDRAMYAFYVAHDRDAAATAREFGVTMKTVYQRVRLVEEADYRRRQGQLFHAQGDDA